MSILNNLADGPIKLVSTVRAATYTAGHDIPALGELRNRPTPARAAYQQARAHDIAANASVSQPAGGPDRPDRYRRLGRRGSHKDGGTLSDIAHWSREPRTSDGRREDLMSARLSAASGYACRRARNTGSALAACTLIAACVLAGCSSPATGPSSAAPTRPAVSGASAATRVFSSPHYGYTMVLPAGWSGRGAQPWDGPGSRGLAKDSVDVFRGPPYVTAWTFAAPMPPSLTGYATATARAAAQVSCPAAPQIDQQVTISGAVASLIGMTCPSQAGVYMLTAATTHKQTAVVFVFEDTSGVRATRQADRRAFRELLTGVRFR